MPADPQASYNCNSQARTEATESSSSRILLLVHRHQLINVAKHTRMRRIGKIDLIPTYSITFLPFPEHSQQRTPNTPRRQAFQNSVLTNEKLRYEVVALVDLGTDLLQSADRQSVQCKNFFTK